MSLKLILLSKSASNKAKRFLIRPSCAVAETASSRDPCDVWKDASSSGPRTILCSFGCQMSANNSTQSLKSPPVQQHWLRPGTQQNWLRSLYRESNARQESSGLHLFFVPASLGGVQTPLDRLCYHLLVCAVRSTPPLKETEPIAAFLLHPLQDPAHMQSS